MSTRIIVVVLLVAVAACGMRPVVYNDQHYQEVGTERAREDVDQCMDTAKHDVGRGSTSAGKVATSAGVGTVVGAASGAAGGAIWGNAGRGAASGAVAGLVGGVLWSLIGKREPDPVYKNYVDLCLQERGYQVAGWR
jgi:hypothetical protein